MTTTIAILGRKGGIGKSTNARALADGCALAGYKTLLVDGDGQGNASEGVGISKHDGFYNLVMQDAEWSDVLVKIPETYLVADHYYLLSASDAQRYVESNPDATTIIYNRFRELEEYFDVIVVDTSPGINYVHSAMYYVADYILLPTQCEMDSILSLASSISYIHEAQEQGRKSNIPTAEILGIIPNMYDKRNGVEKGNVGYIRGRYHEYHVFDPIGSRVVWKDASQNRSSIFSLDGDFFERRAHAEAKKDVKPILSKVIHLVNTRLKEGNNV